MVKRFIIHIGTEKTGSTSIQTAGRVNRSFLAERGILYPTTPGEDNHIGMALAVGTFAQTAILRNRFGLITKEAFNKFQSSFWQLLDTEIKASSCATVLISNEHLSSRVASETAVDQIASFALGIAEEVEIVAYLRPQHELAASSYSTRVKMGFTGALQDILPKDDSDHFFNYEKMLALWANAFGDRHISVRLFDRNSLKSGNVVQDFFTTVFSLTDLEGFTVGKELNQSLDCAAAEFLRLMNKSIPPFIGGKLNPKRGRISSILSGKNFGPKLTLSADQAGHLMAVFDKSNAAVAKRYLGREDGGLFPRRPHMLPRGSEDALTSELAVKIASAMWISAANIPSRPVQYSQAPPSAAQMRQET